MTDVMLDFETLGNGNSKCVCQIGAVYFDKTTGELGRSFYVNVDAASHVRVGAKIDAETVYWWLQQSNEARASILAGNKLDVTEAFTQLNDFMADAKRIWSHATFDFVTLTDTLKQLNIEPKFRYTCGLDLRTLSYLANLTVSKTAREGTHHDALDDCKHQVKYAVAALNTVKGNVKVISAMKKLLED